MTENKKNRKTMKPMKHILLIFLLSYSIITLGNTDATCQYFEFQSTSSMLGSGSQLPSAAQTGVSLTETKQNRPPSRPRRVNSEDGYGDPDYDTKIGDALWPLLALAAVYAVLRVYRRKRVQGLTACRLRVYIDKVRKRARA